MTISLDLLKVIELMPNYSFETLSGNEFEILVRDLLQKELGVLLESFKSGRDKGIDLRYAPSQDNSLIVQCKHYVGSGTTKLIADLKKYESPKANKLSPKRYVIATSVGLSPSNKDEILEMFSSCTSTSDIYGRDDLNNLLARHPDVEAVHYKLWLSSTHILEMLVKSATINRTRLDLERIHGKLKYYVQNASFIRAKEILDSQNYCIITGIPGIGKTTLAEALFIDYVSKGFEPVRIYQSIDEGFEMVKQGVSQVFYFDDFLGTTIFDEHSLERNEDKQLLNFLQSVLNSSGTKKLILTSRDYILKQARLSFESVRSADLKPHLCIINLHNYTRFNRAEILYNHLYFSELSKKHIADLLNDQLYLAIIDHPNYSPRVIEWMTQMKNRWPQHEHDFAVAFLDALDNPMELWKHAFERNLSVSAQYVLWILATLPDLARIDDLERVFWPFQRYLAEYYMHTIDAAGFHSALEEIEGTFIEIDLFAAGIRMIRFHNPSIRDFLEAYLSEHEVVVRFLIRSAQFFSQLRWLWGKYDIRFQRSKKPKQIKPRYRVHLLKHPDDLIDSSVRTLYLESPFLHITTNSGRRSFRLASRLLLIIEINHILNDARLSQLLTDAIPLLKSYAKQGKEASSDLIKLAKSFKSSPYFSDIQEAFLFSLSSPRDFELYLIYKLGYSNELTASDETFVTQRFSDLYPGHDLSYIEGMEDYDYETLDFYDFDDDDGLGDLFDENRENEQHIINSEEEIKGTKPQKRDPNEVIANLFDSLK